jgi:hypothetical protein
VQSVTGCGGTLVGSTYTTGPVTADCTVTASFTLNQYTVSTQVAAGQGSFSPANATVAHGDTASFTVTPAAGYSVQSVTGCGGTLQGSTYTTGPVTADCAVTASFRRLPHALRLTVRDPLVNACGESVIDLQLVDADENPVQADPSAPVTVTLGVAAPSGTPRIINVGLEDAVLQGSNSVTGRMPSGGSSTVAVSLDAADILTVSWSSPDLPGSPPTGPATQVTFQVGPVDPVTSSVSANGTQVFAGSGSVEVTIIPRDACGLRLGPGHLVNLGTSHGSLTDVVDRGDGTYTAIFSSGPGVCPADPALIAATVNSVVLNDRPQVRVLCAQLDPNSPVTLLPGSENIQACASKGQFARVRVIPRDAQGGPLPPGQAVTLVENPPYIIAGGVETTRDDATGATIYTVLVGSNRCSLDGPRSIEVRVANIPLATRPTLGFACPPILEGGVSYTATPEIVPADGVASSQVRISVVDACGNPGFRRPLILRSHGDLPVTLSDESATTKDELGSPEDGTVLVEVRSNEAGTTGVATRTDNTWHESDGDLITFVSPDDPGFYLGGSGVFFGCATTDAAKSDFGGAVAGLLWLGILLVLRSRKVTR